MTASTQVYRQVMLECERRRRQLGWPMWRLDEASGVQENFYAKMLHADTPSGRQARWETLELIVSALFPDGYTIEFKAQKLADLSVLNFRQKIRFEKAHTDPKSRRELMRELGSKGGKARLIKMTAAQRKAVSRLANRARRAKRQGQKHHEANASKKAEVAATPSSVVVVPS